MLCADVSGAVAGRLGGGELHDFLGMRRHTHGLRARRPLAHGLDDGGRQISVRHPVLGQHPGGDARFLPQKPQQDMFRAHIIVSQLAGRFMSQLQRPLGPFCPSVVCHLECVLLLSILHKM